MSWPPGSSCGAYLHTHSSPQKLKDAQSSNTGHANSMHSLDKLEGCTLAWDLSGTNMGALYEQELALQVLPSLLLSQWAWWILVPEHGEIQRCRKRKKLKSNARQIISACMHVMNLFSAPGNLRGQEHCRIFFKGLKCNDITKISSQVNTFYKSSKTTSSSRFIPISNEWRPGLKYYKGNKDS